MNMRRFICPAICFWSLVLMVLSVCSATGAEIEHLTLDVNIGGSELVEIREPSQKMKILISNSDIIGARPLRPNLISVYNLGKKSGTPGSRYGMRPSESSGPSSTSTSPLISRPSSRSCSTFSPMRKSGSTLRKRG